MVAFLRRLLACWPLRCRHRHTYRERQTLHGIQVMHFVCEACGNATPAMERTAKGHKSAVKVSAHPTARIVRTSAPKVASIKRTART